ncbi:ZP domain-containing protein-like [Ciona intestinalis]
MCKPRILSLPDGSLTATFLLFNILSCGYRSTMTGDSITLTYDVRNVKQVTASVIERYYEAVISFNCTFNRSVKLDSSSVLPKISKVDVAAQSAEGRFDISMNLFRDENCTMPFQGQGGNPPVVMVEDYIYFKAALSRQLPMIVLQAPTCWATPTSNAQSNPKYNIISGGCASAMDSSKIKVIKNYETYYISAGVASFIWTNITDQRIYIHCEVDVCSSTASNCTGPVCSSRKKRDTKEVMGGGKKIYSIGPITVAATCDQLEPGICSQKCDVVQGKPKCSCVDGYYLADDERTCIYYQNDAVSTSHSDLTTLIQLGMFLILIGCMCWLLVKKKRTKE